MPMLEGIRKVMLIGSGPIVIGQAAEFDYAGTQACRVLKQAGLEVVLVNSNPATIMTDRAEEGGKTFAADEVYLEPLTAKPSPAFWKRSGRTGCWRVLAGKPA